MRKHFDFTRNIGAQFQNKLFWKESTGGALGSIIVNATATKGNLIQVQSTFALFVLKTFKVDQLVKLNTQKYIDNLDIFEGENSNTIEILYSNF